MRAGEPVVGPKRIRAYNRDHERRGIKLNGNNNPSGTTLELEGRSTLWAIFLGCLIIELVFVLLDVVINWRHGIDSSPIRRLFNIAREDGLAAWFMITQTFVAAAVAWLIWVVLRAQNALRSRRIGWVILAVFFTYMAIDDGAAVHERVGTAFQEFGTITGFPSYTWQIVFGPVFAAMGVFIMYFLWRELPTWPERIRIAAALGCFALAVGLDFVEGLSDGYAGIIQQTGWAKPAIEHFSKSAEEFLEMLGMTLFLVAFVAHLTRVSPRLVFKFG